MDSLNQTLSTVSKNSELFHHTIPVGPLQCNCQILVCSQTGHAALIDPGDEPDLILSEIDSFSKSLDGLLQAPIQIKFMLHTHAHFDHFAATGDLKQTAHPSAKIALHRDDSELYYALKKQGLLFGFNDFKDPLPIDQFIEHQDEITVGNHTIKAIHTPGHSPGGLCFECSGKVFSGDTLFKRNIGRADLWGGDERQLITSIKSRILTLPGEYSVYPGHGEPTTIKDEYDQNPWVR